MQWVHCTTAPVCRATAGRRTIYRWLDIIQICATRADGMDQRPVIHALQVSVSGLFILILSQLIELHTMLFISLNSVHGHRIFVTKISFTTAQAPVIFLTLSFANKHRQLTYLQNLLSHRNTLTHAHLPNFQIHRKDVITYI